MNEENQVYFVDSDKLPPAALERKHRLEQDKRKELNTDTEILVFAGKKIKILLS